MMNERKRRWILGSITAVIILTPISLLNNYTLDRLQREIKEREETKQPTMWGSPLAKFQFSIIHSYRYSLRNEKAAEACQQYYKLFYDAEKNGNEEEKARAEEFIFLFPNILEDLDDRYSAYPYYKQLLDDWPDHPQRPQAEERVRDLERNGYQFPPDTRVLR